MPDEKPIFFFTLPPKIIVFQLWTFLDHIIPRGCLIDIFFTFKLLYKLFPLSAANSSIIRFTSADRAAKISKCGAVRRAIQQMSNKRAAVCFQKWQPIPPKTWNKLLVYSEDSCVPEANALEGRSTTWCDGQGGKDLRCSWFVRVFFLPLLQQHLYTQSQGRQIITAAWRC